MTLDYEGVRQDVRDHADSEQTFFKTGEAQTPARLRRRFPATGTGSRQALRGLAISARALPLSPRSRYAPAAAAFFAKALALRDLAPRPHRSKRTSAIS